MSFTKPYTKVKAADTLNKPGLIYLFTLNKLAPGPKLLYSPLSSRKTETTAFTTFITFLAWMAPQYMTWWICKINFFLSTFQPNGCGIDLNTTNLPDLLRKFTRHSITWFYRTTVIDEGQLWIIRYLTAKKNSMSWSIILFRFTVCKKVVSLQQFDIFNILQTEKTTET